MRIGSPIALKMTKAYLKLDTESTSLNNMPPIPLSSKSAAEFMVITAVNQSAGGASAWSLTAELKEIESADSGMMLDLLSLFIDDSSLRLQTLSSACFRQDFKVVHA